MNMKCSPILRCSFRSKVRHTFKRFQVLRSAIGVAAVIDSINAQEDIVSTCDFSIGKCKRQKNRIPGRNIGDRYLLRHLLKASSMWHVKVSSQGASTKCPQINFNHLL